MKIKKISGREIIDSRGNPTVEAEITLENGIVARGIAPSGASKGKFEALELRDGDKSKFNGYGVTKAVDNINDKISKALIKTEVSDIYTIDKIMLDLDGTKDKSNLGANAILAVSIACSRAARLALNIPLYRFLSDIYGDKNNNILPVPMMNILNGGMHASNSIDTQEFMIMPVGAETYKEGLRWSCEVFHSLKEILKKEGYETSVGDEGGFAPDLAVALNACQIKAGAPSRGERTAKYNRLLRIEEQLGKHSKYAGKSLLAKFKP